MNVFGKGKLNRVGHGKKLGVVVAAGVLAISPFSANLTTQQGTVVLQHKQAQAAGLAEISLLGDQDLRADYNSTTGELTLDLDGLVLLDVGVLSEQNFTYKLPAEFESILELANFQDAARIEYDQRLLLGLISMANGTIAGDDLAIDAGRGLVSGKRNAALDISVASSLSAKLVIDLNELGEDLPVSDSGELVFYSAATKAALVDVFLLTDEGAKTTLYNLENTDLSVGTVTDQDTVIQGVKKRGSATSIRVFNGDREIGRTTVASDSNTPYEVTIPKQPAGAVLTVQAFASDSNSARPTGESLDVTVTDVTAPDKPQVDDVTDQDTTVTGSGEAGTKVTVTKNDQVIGKGTVNGSGDFSIAIPKQSGGTDIGVFLTDDAGLTSPVVKLSVEDTTAPDAPVLKQVTDQSTSVSGTAEAGSTVVIKKGSKELARGKAGTDGRFTVDIDPQTSGTVLTAVAIDGSGNQSKETKTTVTTAESGEADRISGEDRFTTATDISQEGWDTADTVILATSANFPDALAGGPLAFQEDAPILLTRANSLKSETQEEIERLGASRVIILGSTGAISASVEAELESMKLDVDRIGGKTRYETAAMIADELSSDEVVVANGLNFPDALSVSPYAAKNGVPILLTRSDRLPSETEDAVTDYSSTLVIGSTGAVSEEVYNQLPDPERFGGKNRYETGYEVVTRLTLGTDLAFVATGRDFPDALTGSVLAASNDSPILLVRRDDIPEATDQLLDDYRDFTIFGGTGAVSKEVQDMLDEELEE